MVKILVISENNTAVEMIKSVQKILGARAVKNIRPLVIKSTYSQKKVCDLFCRLVRDDKPGMDGILILTEIFGSTQSNLCVDLLDHPDVRIMSGYNLPMLIKAAMLNQSMSLKEIVPELRGVGRKYIRVYSRKK